MINSEIKTGQIYVTQGYTHKYKIMCESKDIMAEKKFWVMITEISSGYKNYQTYGYDMFNVKLQTGQFRLLYDKDEEEVSADLIFNGKIRTKEEIEEWAKWWDK